MPSVKRVSDVKEMFGSRALMALVPGIILLVVGVIMLRYGTLWAVLAWIFIVAGAALTVYGVRQLQLIQYVSEATVECPFCGKTNNLTTKPMDDVRCEHCQRLIPITAGVVLAVSQVRCGYCNTLNYYSEKSTGLICENCDREIPISTSGESEVRQSLYAYTRQDDENLYDLVLLKKGNKTEEMIALLQHMLALNRNQVKEIMESAPVTLLVGIPRKKAELLKVDIAQHGGDADFKVSDSKR